MASKISFIYSIFAVICLISSIQSVSPPTNYTWPQNTQKLCFAGRFDLSLNVQYLQANGTNVTVNVPLNNNTYETYSVDCSMATHRELTITMLGSYSIVIFGFTVNEKNETSLSRVSGFITMNDKQTVFPNYAPSINGTHQFSSNESLFSTDRGNSYRCNTKTTIKGFSEENGVTVVSVEVENLRIQPFVDQTQTFSDYGVEKVCAADDEKSSNLVPIIVGACLAVLVVIVLVAYIIGRRRSRNGYQSV